MSAKTSEKVKSSAERDTRDRHGENKMEKRCCKLLDNAAHLKEERHLKPVLLWIKARRLPAFPISGYVCQGCRCALYKLKDNLQRLGLSRRIVRRALIQLTTKPRVVLDWRLVDSYHGSEKPPSQDKELLHFYHDNLQDFILERMSQRECQDDVRNKQLSGSTQDTLQQANKQIADDSIRLSASSLISDADESEAFEIDAYERNLPKKNSSDSIVLQNSVQEAQEKSYRVGSSIKSKSDANISRYDVKVAQDCLSPKNESTSKLAQNSVHESRRESSCSKIKIVSSNDKSETIESHFIHKLNKRSHSTSSDSLEDSTVSNEKIKKRRQEEMSQVSSSSEVKSLSTLVQVSHISSDNDISCENDIARNTYVDSELLTEQDSSLVIPVSINMTQISIDLNSTKQQKDDAATGTNSKTETRKKLSSRYSDEDIMLLNKIKREDEADTLLNKNVKINDTETSDYEFCGDERFNQDNVNESRTDRGNVKGYVKKKRKNEQIQEKFRKLFGDTKSKSESEEEYVLLASRYPEEEASRRKRESVDSCASSNERCNTSCDITEEETTESSKRDETLVDERSIDNSQKSIKKISVNPERVTNHFAVTNLENVIGKNDACAERSVVKTDVQANVNEGNNANSGMQQLFQALCQNVTKEIQVTFEKLKIINNMPNVTQNLRESQELGSIKSTAESTKSSPAKNIEINDDVNSKLKLSRASALDVTADFKNQHDVHSCDVSQNIDNLLTNNTTESIRTATVDRTTSAVLTSTLEKNLRENSKCTVDEDSSTLIDPFPKKSNTTDIVLSDVFNESTDEIEIEINIKSKSESACNKLSLKGLLSIMTVFNAIKNNLSIFKLGEFYQTESPCETTTHKNTNESEMKRNVSEGLLSVDQDVTIETTASSTQQLVSSRNVEDTRNNSLEQRNIKDDTTLGNSENTMGSNRVEENKSTESTERENRQQTTVENSADSSNSALSLRKQLPTSSSDDASKTDERTLNTHARIRVRSRADLNQSVQCSTPTNSDASDAADSTRAVPLASSRLTPESSPLNTNSAIRSVNSPWIDYTLTENIPSDFSEQERMILINLRNNTLKDICFSLEYCRMFSRERANEKQEKYMMRMSQELDNFGKYLCERDYITVVNYIVSKLNRYMLQDYPTSISEITIYAPMSRSRYYSENSSNESQSSKISSISYTPASNASPSNTNKRQSVEDPCTSFSGTEMPNANRSQLSASPNDILYIPRSSATGSDKYYSENTINDFPRARPEQTVPKVNSQFTKNINISHSDPASLIINPQLLMSMDNSPCISRPEQPILCVDPQFLRNIAQMPSDPTTSNNQQSFQRKTGNFSHAEQPILLNINQQSSRNVSDARSTSHSVVSMPNANQPLPNTNNLQHNLYMLLANKSNANEQFSEGLANKPSSDTSASNIRTFGLATQNNTSAPPKTDKRRPTSTQRVTSMKISNTITTSTISAQQESQIYSQRSSEVNPKLKLKPPPPPPPPPPPYIQFMANTYPIINNIPNPYGIIISKVPSNHVKTSAATGDIGSGNLSTNPQTQISQILEHTPTSLPQYNTPTYTYPNMHQHILLSNVGSTPHGITVAPQHTYSSMQTHVHDTLLNHVDSRLVTMNIQNASATSQRQNFQLPTSRVHSLILPNNEVQNVQQFISNNKAKVIKFQKRNTSNKKSSSSPQQYMPQTIPSGQNLLQDPSASVSLTSTSQRSSVAPNTMPTSSRYSTRVLPSKRVTSPQQQMRRVNEQNLSPNSPAAVPLTFTSQRSNIAPNTPSSSHSTQVFPSKITSAQVPLQSNQVLHYNFNLGIFTDIQKVIIRNHIYRYFHMLVEPWKLSIKSGKELKKWDLEKYQLLCFFNSLQNYIMKNIEVHQEPNVIQENTIHFTISSSGSSKTRSNQNNDNNPTHDEKGKDQPPLNNDTLNTDPKISVNRVPMVVDNLAKELRNEESLSTSMLKNKEASPSQERGNVLEEDSIAKVARTNLKAKVQNTKKIDKISKSALKDSYDKQLLESYPSHMQDTLNSSRDALADKTEERLSIRENTKKRNFMKTKNIKRNIIIQNNDERDDIPSLYNTEDPNNEINHVNDEVSNENIKDKAQKSNSAEIWRFDSVRISDSSISNLSELRDATEKTEFTETLQPCDVSYMKKCVFKTLPEFDLKMKRYDRENEVTSNPVVEKNYDKNSNLQKPIEENIEKLSLYVQKQCDKTSFVEKDKLNTSKDASSIFDAIKYEPTNICPEDCTEIDSADLDQVSRVQEITKFHEQSPSKMEEMQYENMEETKMEISTHKYIKAINEQLKYLSEQEYHKKAHIFVKEDNCIDINVKEDAQNHSDVDTIECSASEITTNLEITSAPSILNVRSISPSLFEKIDDTDVFSQQEVEILGGTEKESSNINEADVDSKISNDMEDKACLRCKHKSTVCCEACLVAYYCSKRCSTLHWNTHYKYCKPRNDSTVAKIR